MIETSSPQTWVLSFGFKHCNVLESNSEVVYLFDVPYLIYRTNVESHQCFINLSPCHWHGTNRCKFDCSISSWNCNETPHSKQKHNIDNRTQTLTILPKTTWTHLQNQIVFCSTFLNPTETISQKWPTIDVPNIHTLLAFSNARPKLCWFWWPGTKRFGDGSSPEPANVKWWWLNVTHFNHSRWFYLEKFVNTTQAWHPIWVNYYMSPRKKNCFKKRQQKESDQGISLNIPSRSIKLTPQKGASVFCEKHGHGWRLPLSSNFTPAESASWRQNVAGWRLVTCGKRGLCLTSNDWNYGGQNSPIGGFNLSEKKKQSNWILNPQVGVKNKKYLKRTN